MKLDRAKNTKRNTVWGAISGFVSIPFSFALRMIMIRTLGNDYLGLDSLFTSVLTVLNLSEMGFSTAIVYSMYKPIAEDDTAKVCALLKLYRKLYRTIGVIISALGVAIMPFLKYFIKGGAPADINLYIVYLIFLTNTVIGYLTVGYKTAIPSAMQRRDAINKVNLLGQVLMYAMQITVLLTVKNYYVYAIALPLASLLDNVILSIYVDRKFPEYRAVGEVSDETRKEIRVSVSGLMINKVCQTTRNALDSICISTFIGLAATTIYNNYFLIFTTVKKFLSLLIEAMNAGVGNSIALDSKEKNHSDMLRINFIYMWIAGWCAITMMCLYQPAVELMFKRENLLGEREVILFGIYFYALSMIDVRNMYSDGKGLWWKTRYVTIGESIANIVLNILLGKLFGIPGIIFATIISILVFNFVGGSRVVYKNYFKNRMMRVFVLNHVCYAFVTAVAAALTLIVSYKVPLTGIALMAVRLVICVVVPNVIYLICYCRMRVFKEAYIWAKNRFLHVRH